MSTLQNMGPFTPSNFKGGARFDAVPVFLDKLPVTIGGIAGEDAIFGRVVSRQGSSHQFLKGIPAGSVPCGILILDPTIGYADPAMNNKYYEGRPATAVTFGMIEFANYDLTLKAPNFGSKVLANNADGRIGFVNAADTVPSGWTAISATVYDIGEPNGVKVWLNMTGISSAVTMTAVATPTATPGAGAVAAGTGVQLATTTPNARILYTLDGTTPTMESPVFPAQGLAISAPVTITAIAVAEGMNPSAALTAAYTIA